MQAIRNALNTARTFTESYGAHMAFASSTTLTLIAASTATRVGDETKVKALKLITALGIVGMAASGAALVDKLKLAIEKQPQHRRRSR